MKSRSRLALLAVGLFALLPATQAQAKLVTKNVVYKQDQTTLQGYLAYDDRYAGKRPGVVVVHQWLGLTDYEKRRANMLANLGYVAFALDVYGKGATPKDTKAAGALVAKYYGDRPLLRARTAAGLAELRKQPRVNPKQLAAIGYCFGGGAVLELARSGADLKGVVSFHGVLSTPTPADAKNIKCKVLVQHGASDPHVPLDQVQGFVKEMTDAKVDWYLTMHGNAVHAFTQPGAGNDNSKGAAYNAAADRRSWQGMKDFFAELFQTTGSR